MGLACILLRIGTRSDSWTTLFFYFGSQAVVAIHYAGYPYRPRRLRHLFGVAPSALARAGAYHIQWVLGGGQRWRAVLTHGVCGRWLPACRIHRTVLVARITWRYPSAAAGA